MSNPSLCSKVENLLKNVPGDKETVLRTMLGLARGIASANGAPANLSDDFANAFEALTTEQINKLKPYETGPVMIVQDPDAASANGQGRTIQIHATPSP